MGDTTIPSSDDLQLVGSKSENRALRRTCPQSPSIGWMTSEQAKKWQGNDFPLQLTTAAIKQWNSHMQRCVDLARACGWHGVADQELAEWDHDRRLIEKQKPDLSACFTTDLRGDGDEFLRRANRIRRLADEFLKVLEYGHRVHSQGRDVRHDEHPLGAAKHAQGELLNEVDACSGRRWRRMSGKCSELRKSLQQFTRFARLTVTDADGYSRLADRWLQIQQPYADLISAIQACELAIPAGGGQELPQAPETSVKMRTGGRKPDPRITNRNERIIRALEDGASTDVITERFRVSAATVRKIRSKAKCDGKM